MVTSSIGGTPRPILPKGEVSGLRPPTFNIKSPLRSNSVSRIYLDRYKGDRDSTQFKVNQKQTRSNSPLSVTNLTPLHAKNAPKSDENSILGFVRNFNRKPRIGVRKGVNTKASKSILDAVSTKSTSKAIKSTSKPDKQADTANRKENEQVDVTWFPQEIRMLKRTAVRPDLNPRHPDYWKEVATFVNGTTLGKKKQSRVIKTAADCQSKYTELMSDISIPKPKPTAKAKAKSKADSRTVTQRLKGNTKHWELNKLVNERAFVSDKENVKLNLISKPPAKTKTTTSIEAPFATRSPVKGSMINSWASGTPKIKKATGAAPFALTPLAEKAHLMSKRTSVDWDMLTGMGSEVLGENRPPTSNQPKEDSHEETNDACELYKDLDGPQGLDHIRGIQRMQKIIKKGKGKPPTDQVAKLKPQSNSAAQKKTMKILQANETYANLRQMLSEYRTALKMIRDDPSENADMQQEAFCLAEDLLEKSEREGLVIIGSEWDSLTSSNDFGEYEKYIMQLENKINK